MAIVWVSEVQAINVDHVVTLDDDPTVGLLSVRLSPGNMIGLEGESRTRVLEALKPGDPGTSDPLESTDPTRGVPMTETEAVTAAEDAEDTDAATGRYTA